MIITLAPAQMQRREKINSFRSLLAAMTRYPRTIRIIVKFYWLCIDRKGFNVMGFFLQLLSQSIYPFITEYTSNSDTILHFVNISGCSLAEHMELKWLVRRDRMRKITTTEVMITSNFLYKM